jgi:uncharacterized protein (DUF885 family)
MLPASRLRPVFALLCLALATSGTLHAQKFNPKDLGPAPGPPGAIPAPPAHPASLEARTQSLNEVFRDYWQDKLQQSPEFASRIGDHAYDGQLADRSARAYNDALARGLRFIEGLGEIDTVGMTAQQKLNKRLLVDDLVLQQESSACEPWQTPVTPFFGIQVELPKLVQSLRFASAQDYTNYLARLNAIPSTFLQVETNMMLGEQAGRSEPQFLMQSVLAQAKSMAAAKPEDTPFARPIAQFPAAISPAQQAQIREHVLATIQRKVLPAYSHFARYLEADYIPHARQEAGLWANQGGDACYAHLVHKYTGTDLTPVQINRMGEQDVAHMESQLLALAHQAGYKDLQAFQQALQSNPKQHAQSGEQLVGLYRRYEEQMIAKLPALVEKIPNTPLKVAAMPASSFAHEPALEYQPSVGGSAPAFLYVNAANPSNRWLPPAEAAAYREGVPGRHLQVSLQREMIGVPQFRRYQQEPGFSNGWALYSEQLGKEAGFDRTPAGQFGLLEDQLFHAALLVVDTGVHARHWTREQAVKYLSQHTAASPSAVHEAVDRLVAEPGRALGYDGGRLQILQLRGEAEKALGKNFDIRSFHDELLDSGPLPFDILGRRVQAWIKQQENAKR